MPGLTNRDNLYDYGSDGNYAYLYNTGNEAPTNSYRRDESYNGRSTDNGKGYPNITGVCGIDNTDNIESISIDINSSDTNINENHGDATESNKNTNSHRKYKIWPHKT